jgi:hypothetical protein
MSPKTAKLIKEVVAITVPFIIDKIVEKILNAQKKDGRISSPAPVRRFPENGPPA